MTEYELYTIITYFNAQAIAVFHNANERVSVGGLFTWVKLTRMQLTILTCIFVLASILDMDRIRRSFETCFPVTGAKKMK